MGQILVRRHLSPDSVKAGDELPVLDFRSSSPLPDFSQSALPLTSLNRSQTAAGDAGVEGLQVETSAGVLTIRGDSVLCPCPECNAPLSIRLWLMIADCWQCETAVELSEEQQAAIRQALESHAAALAASSSANPTAASSTATLETAAATASTLDPAASNAPSTPQAPRRKRRPPTPTPVRLPTEKPLAFQLGPAWIASLLVHVLLILLLALITIQSEEGWDSITLSSFVSPEDVEGGVQLDLPKEADLSDELPLPESPELSEMTASEIREVVARADQDARELQLDPSPDVPLPGLGEVRQRLTGEPGTVSSFAARDPRLRTEIVTQEGGTLLTEAAVSRGLRWLADHQNQDGSWSLNDYERSKQPDNKGDAAGTSLALLPFLGAGQTHEYGIYKTNVAKGLQWLIRNQKPNGDLRAGIDDTKGMYAHGQGTIVLVEALAMTGDERFRDPAQRAIDFVVAAQHEEGGWRYRPNESGDTSVVGWQLMALQSARAPGTGLRVPDQTLKLASYYLDLSSSENGSRYAYMPVQRGNATPSMTAEALLCRMYLGWPKEDPRLRAGLQWLEANHSPIQSRENLYYWYYATQVFHHVGGKSWEKWNTEMRDMLVNAQVKQGANAGSWDPEQYEFGRQGGRIFTTSLGVCILEVYYRHLPLFKQLDLGEEAAAE